MRVPGGVSIKCCAVIVWVVDRPVRWKGIRRRRLDAIRHGIKKKRQVYPVERTVVIIGGKHNAISVSSTEFRVLSTGAKITTVCWQLSFAMPSPYAPDMVYS